VSRELRADLLLIENIKALLHARRVEDAALAIWCGHSAPWISKILRGERGVQIPDLGKIADFFGLTVSELFHHGISPLTERRHGARRTGAERRALDDRRQTDVHRRLHPDMSGTFPAKRPRHHDGDGEGDDGAERAS
jgi:transcriptional regulator with XRE-family HTH domain